MCTGSTALFTKVRIIKNPKGEIINEITSMYSDFLWKVPDTNNKLAGIWKFVF